MSDLAVLLLNCIDVDAHSVVKDAVGFYVILIVFPFFKIILLFTSLYVVSFLNFYISCDVVFCILCSFIFVLVVLQLFCE